MATLLVPRYDREAPFPTLGYQVIAFIQERLVFGPGSLHGQTAVVDAEKRGLIQSAYEVFPQHHEYEGMRHFERVNWELRKGVAKTEGASWVCGCELHPEGPVRFNGFDPNHYVDLVIDGEKRRVYDGLAEGRPVRSPFIPMLATGEEQVQELAYGVLKYILEHSCDADMFDIGLDRIVRLGPRYENDGEAKAVSNAPNQRDGARTTFQHFDEPHRIYLPRAREAVDTMMNNMGKRVLEDPWTLATSTAGKPGQGSVQEDIRKEAEQIDRRELDNPRFFFFSRWAGQEHDDLSTVSKREAAVADATGKIGEWGKGQFNRIARDYDRVGGDKGYWEQVWLNRWRKSDSQTFNLTLIKDLRRPGYVIPDGTFIAAGFDGARRKDSTAIVIGDIDSGDQQLVACWEKDPLNDDWSVPEAEVTAVVSELRQRYDLWQLWGDPPHWTESLASWATLWPDQVMEFHTNQYKRMAYCIRAYLEAFDTGTIHICGLEWQIETMLTHMGSAGKKELPLVDDQGVALAIMEKMDGRLSEKFDAAMAGCICWTAVLDARRKGVRPIPKIGMPRRIR